MRTLKKRLLTVLFFASGFRPHVTYAQDLSPADILKKVAENYGRISSFSVIAEKTIDLDTDTSGRTHLRLDSHDVVAGSHESQDIQITLLASSSSKAKLLLTGNRKKVVVVSDGKLVWTSIPAQHAYTEAPVRASDTQAPVFILQIGNSNISGMDLLEEYEALVATRFRSISGYESQARMERSETLKVGKEKKECYVVTIQETGGTKKQKLWVDKRDFIVWKTVDKTEMASTYLTDGLDTTVTVEVKQLILNPSADASNFAFKPPDQARKVDSLKVGVDSLNLSANNPF